MIPVATTKGTALYTERNTGLWSTLPMEKEANIFAARLLAPAIVLRRIEAYTPDKIAGLCGLSQQAAEVRSKRMHVLVNREKERLAAGLPSNFGLTADERWIESQFAQYIDALKPKNRF